MTKPFFFFCLFLCFISSYAQVGIGTTNPDPSSSLDITSTNSGLLIPRMSQSDRDNINNPVSGLLIYQTDNNPDFYYYNNSNTWVPISKLDNDWIISGNDMYNANSGNVGVGTNAPSTKFHIETSGTSSNILNQDFESGSISPLTTSGNASWSADMSIAYAGAYSAISGSMVSNSNIQSSTISYNATIPSSGANLSFQYSVSSEINYDFLQFYIDGVKQAEWSGNVDWTAYSINLTPGSHVITWSYVKDGTNDVGSDQAYLDNIVISSTAPAILRIVDGNQGDGRILTSDANGNGTWKELSNANIPDIPLIASIKQMTIPICNTSFVGDTGSFIIDIKGVATTVDWEILDQQIKSGSTNVSGQELANAEVLAEKLQVRYDFSPQLPFNPQGLIFSANNDSGFPDIFTLNYANKSQSSLTMNIARVDRFADQTGASCWQGQFYFDAFITD